MIFPEIFKTGKIDEDRNDERALCADALCGWACCMAGGTIPEMFGHGMAAISKRLGIAGYPESIEKFAKDKGFL